MCSATSFSCGDLISLEEVPWWSQTRRAVKLETCSAVSYSTLWIFSKSIANKDPSRVCRHVAKKFQREAARFGPDSSRQTSCNCDVVGVFVVRAIEGRFFCSDRGVEAKTNVLFYWILFGICGVFFSPSVPRMRLSRWVLWSPFFLNFFRRLRWPVAISSPDGGVPEVFLADGGHIDNSGVLPLLRRRCPLIIAVDAAVGRNMHSIQEVIRLSSEEINCSWEVPHDDGRRDLDQYIRDFQLPRARFVGAGEDPEYDDANLTVRAQLCWKLLTNASHAIDVEESLEEGLDCSQSHKWTVLNEELSWQWLPDRIRQLVSHVRKENGHVYVYFHTDNCVYKAFVHFPVMRENLRICQHIELAEKKGKNIFDSDFLSSNQQTSETLRNYLHLRVVYPQFRKAEIFFVRGECSHDDLQDIRERLEPHEKRRWNQSPLSVPAGLFPSHKTGAEGYAWPHISEYARYCRHSLDSAWGDVSAFLNRP